MKRLMCLTSLVVAALVLHLGSVSSKAEGDDLPSIGTIMDKSMKGPKSLRGMLSKELRAAQPDWDNIQKHTKEFAELAAALGKNDPPKGEKDSWTKLSDAYLKNAQALDDAAKASDKKAAMATMGKISKSCMACHKAHRGG